MSCEDGTFVLMNGVVNVAITVTCLENLRRGLCAGFVGNMIVVSEYKSNLTFYYSGRVLAIVVTCFVWRPSPKLLIMTRPECQMTHLFYRPSVRKVHSRFSAFSAQAQLCGAHTHIVVVVVSSIAGLRSFAGRWRERRRARVTFYSIRQTTATATATARIVRSCSREHTYRNMCVHILSAVCLWPPRLGQLFLRSFAVDDDRERENRRSLFRFTYNVRSVCVYVCLVILRKICTVFKCSGTRRFLVIHSYVNEPNVYVNRNINLILR